VTSTSSARAGAAAAEIASARSSLVAAGLGVAGMVLMITKSGLNWRRVAVPGENEELDRGGRAGVPFKRHFLLPGIVLTAAEILLIAMPLLSLFEPVEASPAVLMRIAVPVFAGATLVWWAAMAAWLSPLQKAIQLRRRGKRLPKQLASAAYRATWRVPLRAMLLRSVLWILVVAAHGIFLLRYSDWQVHNILEMSSVAAVHAFATSMARAIWYAAILAVVRERLFSGLTPVRRFADAYFGRLVMVAFVVFSGSMAAVAAFLYYFLPISLEQYVQILAYFPIALGVGLIVWALVARRQSAPIDAYLAVQLGGDDRREADTETSPSTVYRRAQSLPYRLAGVSLGVWVVVAGIGTFLARKRFRFELDDAIVMLGVALVIAAGAAIYESLWHRETLRPLLRHLTVRHRLPVRGIRPTVSLRTKLLLSFGGVVLFSCGLALFWAFVQYKNLTTDFVTKQAELGLTWLRSEVKGASAGRASPPTSDLVREVLHDIDRRSPEASAVYYFLGNEPDSKLLALGGGPMGAPELPWYAIGQMKLGHDEDMEVGSLDLVGRHGRVVVNWRGADYDLGAIAVFYPTYSGRGQSIVRPVKELLVFFLVLFGACAGIVLFTVWQFVMPIRRLEQRAEAMARGELAEPVSSGGEGDEVGRLTFALEEMRRALREKLRSTEEVNLDLERAVQRRTADLAKKNRELAETLDKLTRAQDQLVRSEKMASIGQLVAGIAHEINNPVNAIVNTVGPLEESMARMDSRDLDERREAADDVREMLQVVQRGANRTKAIVQALHTYSRTDDESVVEFDLNRSIDDSLELLRHMLKKNIAVHRNYGEVGRIRGHAGQLNQVFMNLLANAAQALAGRDGATIEIETAEREGKVCITLRDNGGGIPPDVLPRIFDPFFTTKDVGEGSGLGLSIVHGIVERHGGTIEVDSKVGEGTTFTVVLPRTSVDPGASDAA